MCCRYDGARATKKAIREPEIRLGDLGTAKRRLCSFIAGTRYDPKVCGQIGDICRDMKDPCEAGRWYFISDRPTKQVRKEVFAFLSMHNSKLSVVLAQMPSRAKLTDMSAYPEPVRERLESIGCETAPGTKRTAVVQGAIRKEGGDTKLDRAQSAVEALGCACVAGIGLVLLAILGHLMVEGALDIWSDFRDAFL